MNRVELAEACARRWQALGIRWALVHGLEGYPDRLGRDLDILVAEADESGMMASAVEVLEEAGWITAHPPDIWGRRIIGFGGEEALELHAVTRLGWREVELVAEPTPTDTVGPFPIDRWASLVKQVAMPALAGEEGRAISALVDFGVLPESGIANQGTFPRKRILAALSGGHDPKANVRAIAGLKGDLVRHQWRIAPVRTAGALFGKLVGKVLPFIFPSGIRVGIDGTDADLVGAVLHTIGQARRSVFTGVRVRPEAGAATTNNPLPRIRRVWRGLIRFGAERGFLRQQTVLFFKADFSSGDRRPFSRFHSGARLFLTSDVGGRSFTAGWDVIDVSARSVEEMVEAVWSATEKAFAREFPPRR